MKKDNSKKKNEKELGFVKVYEYYNKLSGKLHRVFMNEYDEVVHETIEDIPIEKEKLPFYNIL